MRGTSEFYEHFMKNKKPEESQFGEMESFF